VRLAGENTQEDPDVYQAIWKHLRSDGIPDQAANQMTAEMLTHGEDFESSVEKYQEAESIYKEKGYNEHAAQAMAVESMEDGEQPKKSVRYARLHG
jgi:hypothetical protein